MFSFIFKPSLVIFSGLIYSALFAINSHVLYALDFGVGVNWIFLPAGLRLLLTLLFSVSGALGISIASCFISYFFYFEHDVVLGFGAGIISGLAPFVARFIFFRDLDMESTLSHLNAKKLIYCIIIYSILSPLFHQLWYYSRGVHDEFLQHLGVMIIGDFTGTIIMIYMAKGLMHVRRVLA